MNASAAIPVVTTSAAPPGAAAPGSNTGRNPDLLANDLWCKQVRPSFSGIPAEYPAFEDAWDKFADTATALSATPGNETVRIQSFSSCVDQATQNRIELLLRRHPRITLNEIRRDLQREFRVDPQRRFRKEWEAVRLKCSGPPGRELLAQDWREFTSELLLKREKVGNLTEDEERNRLMDQIPKALSLKVKYETERLENARRFWLRVEYPPQIDGARLIHEVSNVRGLLNPTFQFEPGRCTIETADAIMQAQWRDGLSGTSVGGMPVMVTDFPKEMSVMEIIEFITRFLQTEDEVRGPAGQFQRA